MTSICYVMKNISFGAKFLMTGITSTLMDFTADEVDQLYLLVKRQVCGRTQKQ